jgi:GNAT superfamily N-acetyltransferase
MRVLSRGAAATATRVVHAAVPADAATLAPLCADHAAYERLPYNAAGHTQRLRAALASRQLHAWLLLDGEGGDAVGYASATLDFSTLSGQGFAHMDCLYLAPAARGQGGGLALVLAVQAFARQQGCTTLQWQTPVWNVDAMRFYARLGANASPKQRYTLALDACE